MVRKVLETAWEAFCPHCSCSLFIAQYSENVNYSQRIELSNCTLNYLYLYRFFLFSVNSSIYSDLVLYSKVRWFIEMWHSKSKWICIKILNHLNISSNHCKVEFWISIFLFTLLMVWLCYIWRKFSFSRYNKRRQEVKFKSKRFFC